jgi:CRISPR/Cas system-associated protein Cas5 (RAMP superfamily)|tara:strand:- start:72 stop:251 length:180 start_codon:yes stop_codon:yes gene_type:complete
MKMETILINIEELIDDLERDENLTRTEITEALYKIKEEIEQYKIREEEHPSIDWEDLEY